MNIVAQTIYLKFWEQISMYFFETGALLCKYKANGQGNNMGQLICFMDYPPFKYQSLSGKGY